MKRRIALVAVLVTAGVIAGCGGSDDNMGPADSFINFVKSMVSTSDDAASPVSVDNVAVSDSDTSAPIAVY
ncbi:MAG: hypothetical protein ABIQ86_14385 [Steroidobacteraceae bacterium]